MAVKEPGSNQPSERRLAAGRFADQFRALLCGPKEFLPVAVYTLSLGRERAVLDKPQPHEFTDGVGCRVPKRVGILDTRGGRTAISTSGNVCRHVSKSHS